MQARKYLSQAGQAKGAAMVAGDCSSFLSLKALSSSLSYMYLPSAVTYCTPEDVILPMPVGVVQGCVFPCGWVNFEGSHRCLEDVFEVLIR